MPEPKICSFEGCGKPAIARELCPKHYRMWRRSEGSNFESKWGKPEKFYRDALLEFESDECLVWPFARMKNGYAVMRHNERSILVGRRICEDAHGAPPFDKAEAAHSCGNGHLGCINKRHLSWKTSKQNADDKIAHGTKLVGSACGGSKLTENQALAIYLLRNTRPRQQDVADKYGISRGTVSDIWRRHSWAWLTSPTMPPHYVPNISS